MISMKKSASLLWPILLVACHAQSATPTAAPQATAPAAASKEPTIAIKNFAFGPAETTIAPGTTVHWKNLDGEPHTVRAIDGSFKSDALDQDDSFTFKFDKPGTYRYVCSIHPQMNGTIVVKAAQSK
jgi:plastocyanin